MGCRRLDAPCRRMSSKQRQPVARQPAFFRMESKISLSGQMPRFEQGFDVDETEKVQSHLSNTCQFVAAEQNAEQEKQQQLNVAIE